MILIKSISQPCASWANEEALCGCGVVAESGRLVAPFSDVFEGIPGPLAAWAKSGANLVMHSSDIAFVGQALKRDLDELRTALGDARAGHLDLHRVWCLFEDRAQASKVRIRWLGKFDINDFAAGELFDDAFEVSVEHDAPMINIL